MDCSTSFNKNKVSKPLLLPRACTKLDICARNVVKRIAWSENPESQEILQVEVIFQCTHLKIMFSFCHHSMREERNEGGTYRIESIVKRSVGVVLLLDEESSQHLQQQVESRMH